MTTSPTTPMNTSPLSYEQRLAADKAVLSTLGISASRDQGGDWQFALTVSPERVNAGGICHGGFLFALADTALAYALGAAGHRPATVDANITYLRPALLDDVVVAQVNLVRVGRTQGVADVRLLRRSDSSVLAVFRGTCANLP